MATTLLADDGSPPATHDHAIVYSGSRHTALSQPAFEQCPLLGCAPTGPLRPSIGAPMKRPSLLHLRSGTHPRARLRFAGDRVDDAQRTEVSRSGVAGAQTIPR